MTELLHHDLDGQMAHLCRVDSDAAQLGGCVLRNGRIIETANDDVLGYADTVALQSHHRADGGVVVGTE